MVTSTPRTVPDRIEKRITRLESLLDLPPRGGASALQVGIEARQALLAARTSDDALREIRLRTKFLAKPSEVAGPTRIQHVSTSKGAALKVLLLALFELQARSPRPSGASLIPRTQLALERETPDAGMPSGERPSWINLAALPTADATRRSTHASSRRRNRLRQLHSALERLDQLGRIELKKAPGEHHRYEAFWVLDEGRANDSSLGLTRYTVPEFGRGRERREITTIPLEFFLHGWIDALNDNEIITYLILRLMAQAHPRVHATSGVFLTSGFRLSMFNLDRGFEAHRMLARYGLITTRPDPRRSARGTIHQQRTDGKGNLHQFQLNDAALSQDAPARVITCLQRYADHLTLNESRQRDRDEAEQNPPLPDTH